MSTNFSFAVALSKLAAIGQLHLLAYWNELNDTQKDSLLSQIETIDEKIFFEQQRLLVSPPTFSSELIEPFTSFVRSGNTEDEAVGHRLIEDGKMGCLLIAGGQGSRLNFDGPKGMFPITPITHKTLFQLLAEKVLAASKRAKRPLQLAVMTSPLNHNTTVDFFQKNNFFGLEEGQISFFSQGMLPFLDKNGNLLLEGKDKIACGPDGNGGALHHFYQSGLWDKWYEQGIRYLNFIPVDNPLADPFDAELIGYHERTQSDVIVKCIARSDPFEKVGVLAIQNSKTMVMEYSEIPENLRMAVNADGSVKFPCAYIGLFSVNMEFIRSLNLGQNLEIPLHLAFKSMAWKFEKFIFDVLPKANTVSGLLCPREECFAPLKNFSGADSPATVQQALQRKGYL